MFFEVHYSTDNEDPGKSLEMMRRLSNSSLAEADTISGVSAGETVLTTLLRLPKHDSLDNEDAGDILDDDEHGGEDVEPNVLAGEHDDDDVQGKGHPSHLPLKPILEPVAYCSSTGSL